MPGKLQSRDKRSELSAASASARYNGKLKLVQGFDKVDIARTITPETPSARPVVLNTSVLKIESIFVVAGESVGRLDEKRHRRAGTCSKQS